METAFVDHYLGNLQENIYSSLNAFSLKHPFIGRLGALPLAILDVTIDILKSPLRLIETLALTIINFLGAFFSKVCTLKSSLFYLHHFFHTATSIPINIALSPLKIVYQILAIVSDPTRVTSINFYVNFTHQDYGKIQYNPLRSHHQATS